jgi:hypothetical protein
MWYKVTFNADDPWSPLNPPIPGSAAEDVEAPESPAIAQMVGSHA